MQTKGSEKGQVLVLLVLGVVALLGFTALALDGGMLYSDRRHAQSAADAASLAGGGAAAVSLENSGVSYVNWNCNGSAVLAAMTAGEDAAISRAGQNGYTIDKVITDTHGVDALCGDIDLVGKDDKYIDIKTYITKQTNTSLAHFVYNGTLQSSVEAITRIRPRMPLAYGNAIVAIAEDCPNSNVGGVLFDGGVDTTVTGGGIFSNACMSVGGGGNITVEGGYEIACSYPDCFTQSGGSANISPAPNENGSPMPPESYELDPPTADCNSLPNRGNYNGDGTIEPGRYSSISINNGVHVMEAGLFCFMGSVNNNSKVFSVNGGDLTGNDVTIYVKDGSVSFGGNGTIILNAPPARNCTTACSSGKAMPGVLLYVDTEGSPMGEVSLTGSSENEYLGLVYAPHSRVDVTGTAGETSEVNCQIIAHTVKISGNAEVVVNFDGEENPQIPSKLELYK